MESIKTALIAFLLLVSGALGAVVGYFVWIDVLQTDKIKKLEADVRTEAGKRLDQGEAFEDQLEAARTEQALKVWELEEKVKGCQKPADQPGTGVPSKGT